MHSERKGLQANDSQILTFILYQPLSLWFLFSLRGDVKGLEGEIVTSSPHSGVQWTKHESLINLNMFTAAWWRNRMLHLLGSPLPALIKSNHCPDFHRSHIFVFLCACRTVVVHSVMSDSLQPHALQHASPSPTPRVYSNSCPLSQWCHSTISSSVLPPSNFLALGSFPVSQFFALGSPILEFQLQHQSFQWIFRTDFL